MKKVRPDLDEWFEVWGIVVDGKKIKPEFSVVYVPQQTSWLLVMITRIDGEKYCTPEYSNKPLIDQALISKFCYELETTINRPEKNSDKWDRERNSGRFKNAATYYT